MVGAELVDPADGRTKAPALRNKVVDEAFTRGLLLLGCGQEALLLLICSLESLELLRQPRMSIWIMPAGSPAWY